MNPSETNPSSDQQVEIFFKEESDENATCEKDNCVSLPSIVVSANLNRLGLSKILNQLLNNEEPTPYDFFISLNAVDSNELQPNNSIVHLHTTLSKFMKKYNKTSETRLTLIYKICRPSIRNDTFSSEENWITGLRCCKQPSFSNILVGVARSDGLCQFYSTETKNSDFLYPTHEQNQSKTFCNVSLTSVDLHFNVKLSNAMYAATSSSGHIFFGSVFEKEGTDSQNILEFKDESQYGRLDHCCFNDTGSIIAAGGSEGIVYLWDSKKIQENFTEGQHERKTVDKLTEENVIRKNKKRSRETNDDENYLYGILTGHVASIHDLCYLSNAVSGANLLSASTDHTIRCWDTLCLASIFSWPVACSATSVSANKDSTIFATAHDDGKVRIWDTRVTLPVSEYSDKSSANQLRLMSLYALHRRTIPQIRWSPYDLNTLASVSHDGSLKIIDLRYNLFARQTTCYSDVKLLCVEWIDQKSVLSGASDGCVRTHVLE
ncbi:ribosome biogenesis protein WDR12 homolog [Hylaeus volcanicus]|uniref:ribosome biogenesis protein WDR12 homolog n=1 Tax=Hylaeus volcanicus TaxID=313075 RepID=UPI0023B791FB|nr:ribosome biogenesis protein WDR12 homolog [Hylaeus volcanicus]XP_053992559.1 ribosome biogenesis protein WDR12 homolog [Hylaeus volcanicus]